MNVFKYLAKIQKHKNYPSENISSHCACGQNVRFADTATILGFGRIGQAEQRSLSWNKCNLQKVDGWADSFNPKC